MQRDARAWLSDILTACDLLADFTKDKTFDDYAADALLRSAVERQLQIVGEALRVVRESLQPADQLQRAEGLAEECVRPGCSRLLLCRVGAREEHHCNVFVPG